MRSTTAALLLLTACTGAAPARIAVDSDTLIINGRRPVLIPVRVFDRDGRLIPRPRLTYSRSSGAVQVSNDGGVACTAAGDAGVAISQGALRTQVIVLCRPIFNFRPPALIQLLVGGPSQQPEVAAFDVDGKPVTLLRGTATIRDENVARIEGGRVYPVARGFTSLDMDFGGVSTGIGVEVVERVVQASLRLVGGEFRSWRVPPGWYEIRLDQPDENGRRPALVLAAYRANCAQALSGGQHYYCITKDRAAIVVRNPQLPGVSSRLSGELLVLRKQSASQVPNERQ